MARARSDTIGSGETRTDTAIYEEVKRDMVGFATSLVGPDEAPDVVSTVVARTLAGGGLARLDDPRPYLVRSVQNECRAIHRSRKKALESRRALRRLGTVEPDMSSGLLDTVAGLPFKQRSATYLVYWLGYSATDAADLMGVRPATLRRYLHLARKRVREALDVVDY